MLRRLGRPTHALSFYRGFESAEFFLSKLFTSSCCFPVIIYGGWNDNAVLASLCTPLPCDKSSRYLVKIALLKIKKNLDFETFSSAS